MIPHLGGHPQGLHLVSNCEWLLLLNWSRHRVFQNYWMWQICNFQESDILRRYRSDLHKRQCLDDQQNRHYWLQVGTILVLRKLENSIVRNRIKTGKGDSWFFPSRVEILSWQTDPKINPKLIQKLNQKKEKMRKKELRFWVPPTLPVALSWLDCSTKPEMMEKFGGCYQ